MKLVLVYLGLLGVAMSSNVGMELGFTEAMLESLKTAALPGVIKGIGNIQIPDQQGQIGKDWYEIKVEVYDIVLYGINFSVSDSAFLFSTPNKYILKIEGMYAKTDFKYHYSFPIGHGDGSGNIEISQTNCEVQMTISERNGKPVVTIDNSSVYVGKLDIKFDHSLIGDISNWITSLFNNKLKGDIQNDMNKSIQGSLQKSIDESLSSISLYSKFDNYPIAIDYSLTSDPIVTNDYTEIQALGIFIDTNDPDYNPPVKAPTNLPGFESKGKQIQIMLTDYTLNTGLYAAYKIDIITYNITDQMIPSSSPVHLDTTSLDNVIPGMSAKYGKDKPCNLYCNANAQPNIQCFGSVGQGKGLIQGTIDLNCAVQVEGVNTVAIFQNSIQFNTTAIVKDWVLNYDLDDLEVESIKVVENALNTNIDVKDLKLTLNFIIEAALPTIDKKLLQQGIPLPNSKHATYNDGTVSVMDGYLFIEADPEWHYN
mmetsp:Transcript_12024/g.17585  ORF Transcript_12024/g.17585 Transcript_12024/m.17585 type:complete len:482 (+) Transcript_12024:337-1782(+)